MLGKKRNFDEKRKLLPPQNEIKSNYSSSDSILQNQKSFDKLKVTKEILLLYNMKRSIYLNCLHTKHAKYSNNKIIPCLPFSSLKK